MRNSTWPIVAVLVVAIILVGGFFFFGAQPIDDTTQPAPGVGGGPVEEGVTVSDIIANPNQYVTQTVTLDGEVDRVLTPRMFVLDQEGTLVGDEILVITENQIPDEAEGAIANPFNDADKVTVTGTVSRLVITEVERDLDLDLDPQVEVEFENRPYISASDVTITSPN